MPGNSWRTLGRRVEASESRNRTLGSQPESKPNSQAAAASMSPKLNALLDKRKALEDNLRHLTSGTENGSNENAREAARFPIASHAQRRFSQQQWDKKREQSRSRLQQNKPSNRERGNVQAGGQGSRHGPGSVLQNTGRGLNAPVERTGQTSVNPSLEDWYLHRDSMREKNRQNGISKTSVNSSREAQQTRSGMMGGVTGGLDTLANTAGSARRPLSNATSKLRDLDKRLADQGLDQERKELNKEFKKMGVDKLEKAEKTLGNIEKYASKASSAVNKVDQFWKKRDQQISGPMDRVGPYVARSKQRLSTETGGSGDLFERMQRNRERALQRRREIQRQEQRDEARRRRALKARENNKTG